MDFTTFAHGTVAAFLQSATLTVCIVGIER